MAHIDRINRMRVVADRVEPVVERHAPDNPVVAAIGTKVVPIAVGYGETHDALLNQRVVVRALLAEARARVEEAHGHLHVWRGLLVRELPGFDGRAVDAPVDSPDAVFVAVEHVLEIVKQRGGELKYADVLVHDLGAALERARTAWSGAQEALARLQALQETLGRQDVALGAGLASLRRALREHLGRRHRDYRLLRLVPKRPADDDQSDAEAPDASTTDASEPQGNAASASHGSGGNGASTPVPASKEQ